MKQKKDQEQQQKDNSKPKKKTIIPPPEIAAIFARPGATWLEEELVAVFEWLNSDYVIDAFVKFAFGFTHDLQMAEDVVRDKITYVFRYCHTYDPQKYRGGNNAFLNYLYTIIAREAVERGGAELRRALRQQRMQQRMQQRIAQQAQLAQAQQLKQILLQEIKEKYLSRLPEKYRRAMQLVVFDGLTYAEAAEKEGIEMNNMKQRVFRARHMVRKMREQDESK